MNSKVAKFLRRVVNTNEEASAEEKKRAYKDLKKAWAGASRKQKKVFLYVLMNPGVLDELR